MIILDLELFPSAALKSETSGLGRSSLLARRAARIVGRVIIQRGEQIL